MQVLNISVMAEKKLDHTKEWEKLNNLYMKMAKEENTRDVYWYRHLCIQGLLDGTTYNYN